MSKPAKSILISGILILSIFGLFILLKFVNTDECAKRGAYSNEELKRCETPQEYPKNFYWHIEADTIRNREFLVRGSLIDHISGSANELIRVLNLRTPVCKIEQIGLKNDTIHIRFQQDECLTEQMGSTGAFCFMGETVFTLTENDSISFVDFQINFGSHASPGIYQRSDFQELEKNAGKK